MRVEQGGITGVIGPNGAGKSTALRTLFGLLKPVKGDVYVGDKCVTGIAPWSFISHGVAMVPQSRSLFNELSVDDNLQLACWTFRSDKVRVEQALERAYSRFPMLKDKRNQMAGALSGGQHRLWTRHRVEPGRHPPAFPQPTVAHGRVARPWHFSIAD